MAEANYEDKRLQETARDAFDQAVRNYSSAMGEAKRQNSSALARIAYQALLTQLELIRQGLGQPLTEPGVKTDAEDRYTEVLGQLRAENAPAEEPPR